MGDRGAADDKYCRPGQAPQDPETREEKLRTTESQKDRCDQIRRTTQCQVKEPGNNRASWTDKILGRIVGWADRAEPNPGRNILRCIGNQRQEKNCPDTDQN